MVEDIRPSISEGNRTIDVIARFDNPGPLKSGGSVDASVITGQKEQAVLVPEQAVVLRPAGKVVYLINDGKAKQQIVEVGSKQNGMIEIIKGLNGGETLALDGAGFLSENATVHVKETAKTVAKAESAAK
jgi:RND family efflux transporter MFP subunit